MLAGVGPVPAALIVVAADEGWMPQSAEHLAALDALGVRHGLLVVTRSRPRRSRARRRPRRAAPRSPRRRSARCAAVAVSAVTGAGLDELRAALDRLVAGLPAPPDPTAPVRLWIDRSFTIRGAGTVVTGTLGAGRAAHRRRAGADRRGPPGAGTRAAEPRRRRSARSGAVARVAVNLRGVAKDRSGAGDALLTPGRFRLTDLIDVRVHGDPVADLPATLTLHAGSAAVAGRGSARSAPTPPGCG